MTRTTHPDRRGAGSAPVARRRRRCGPAPRQRRDRPPDPSLARRSRALARRSAFTPPLRSMGTPSTERRPWRRSIGSYAPRWCATACSGVRSSPLRGGVTGAAPTASSRSCGPRGSSRCSWCLARPRGRTEYPSRARGSYLNVPPRGARARRVAWPLLGLPRRGGPALPRLRAALGDLERAQPRGRSGDRGRIPSRTARSTRPFARRSCAWTRPPRWRSADSAGLSVASPPSIPGLDVPSPSDRVRGRPSTHVAIHPYTTDDHPPDVQIPGENNFDDIERVRNQLGGRGRTSSDLGHGMGLVKRRRWASDRQAGYVEQVPGRCSNTAIGSSAWRPTSSTMTDRPDFFQGLLDEHLEPKPAAGSSESTRSVSPLVPFGPDWILEPALRTPRQRASADVGSRTLSVTQSPSAECLGPRLPEEIPGVAGLGSVDSEYFKIRLSERTLQVIFSDHEVPVPPRPPSIRLSHRGRMRPAGARRAQGPSRSPAGSDLPPENRCG